MGRHFLLQGNLPDPGVKPSSIASLHWQANSLPLASHLLSNLYPWCLFPDTHQPYQGTGHGRENQNCVPKGTWNA